LEWLWSAPCDDDDDDDDDDDTQTKFSRHARIEGRNVEKMLGAVDLVGIK